MVQSSDLVRISTVQSTDFSEQSSDLAEDLSKSSSRSEEFIYFVWILVWQSIEDALYTTSPLTDWDLQMVFFWNTKQIGLRLQLSELDHCLNFLFYSSYHEILHGFGMKSSDFSKSLGKSSNIVQISLNPWIYLGIFNFPSDLFFCYSINSVNHIINLNLVVFLGFWAER